MSISSAIYAEPPLVAVNLFHLRNGKIVDRREFFWEDQDDFEPSAFFEALLKQVYLNSVYIPGLIHVPADFESRDELEEFLSEARGHKVEIHTPQRGSKKAAARSGGNQLQTQFRSTFPRSQTIFESHSRSHSRSAQSAGGAAPYRMFRHFAHSRHRQSGQHGGLGRRQNEEVRLPQIHHPHRGRQ